MKEHRSPEHGYDLERLLFLTDGVFAIVITLLVIELRPPADWDFTLLTLIRDEARGLLAFAIGFFAAAMFWNGHRMMFKRIVAFRPFLALLNFVLLLPIVLLPFAAQLIVASNGKGEPFLIYAGVIAAAGLAQALLWGYAAFVGRIVDPRLAERTKLILLASMGVLPVLIALLGLLVAQETSTWLWVAVLIAAVGIARWRRYALRHDEVD